MGRKDSSFESYLFVESEIAALCRIVNCLIGFVFALLSQSETVIYLLFTN